MRYILCFLSLVFASVAQSQDTLKIQPAGQKLKDFYLSMNVENLWIANHHINWETGEPDMPEALSGVRTHCSAFIAAACERLNIYVLRPPQHSQILLANAQYDWLNNASKSSGWTKLNDDDALYKNAQQLADEGKIVVAVYKNTDKSKPGHAALVMPAKRTEAQLKEDGPDLIMAGTHNFNHIKLRSGFRSHITSWPSHEIDFFIHDAAFQ